VIVVKAILLVIFVFMALALTLRIIKGVMLKNTDRVLKRYFATTDIFKDSFNKYRGVMALGIGERFFAVGELKAWQIKEILKVFVQYDFDLQRIIASDEVYYAMGVCLSKSNITERDKQNTMKLGYYFGKEATADQVERFLKIIIAKNNLVSLISKFKEMK